MCMCVCQIAISFLIRLLFITGKIWFTRTYIHFEVYYIKHVDKFVSNRQFYFQIKTVLLSKIKIIKLNVACEDYIFVVMYIYIYMSFSILFDFILCG